MADGRSEGFVQSSVPDAYGRYLLPQLFVPWAENLVARADLRAGQSVLDVASGLGPVARKAAALVGSTGRVVASDISAPMLARAATAPVADGSATIDYLECSATALDVSDETFDAVLCQQGLQFFPDRVGALREMRRAVRRGGFVTVAVWAAEHPLGLLGPLCDAVASLGIHEPYPGAYDASSYVLTSRQLADLFNEAGLRDVVVETGQIEAAWPTLDEAVATVLGTPFGPLVASLPREGQEEFRATFGARLTQSADGRVVAPTFSTTARGQK